MNKQWEKEAWRIEHEEDATITFTIALHGKRAWEMLLEDRDRYYSIGHGWATDCPRDWEEAIAPALRRLFVSGRLDFATKVPVYDSPNGSSANTSIPMYDPPLCSPETRADVTINGGQNRTESFPSFERSQRSDLGFAPNGERQAVQNLQRMVAAE
jgi:hypothetical protein